MLNLVKVLLDDEYSFGKFVKDVENMSNEDLIQLQAELRSLKRVTNDEKAKRINKGGWK